MPRLLEVSFRRAKVQGSRPRLGLHRGAATPCSVGLLGHRGQGAPRRAEPPLSLITVTSLVKGRTDNLQLASHLPSFSLFSWDRIFSRASRFLTPK